jgi:hypothetical protein
MINHFNDKFRTGFDELPEFLYKVKKPVTDLPESVDKAS